MEKLNHIQIDQSDDGSVTHIILDRTNKRNALSPSMLQDLRTAIEKAMEDHSNVIVLRSAAPGSFCAGFDINFLGTPEEEAGEKLLHDCSALIEASDKVTIAVADGLVIGGGLELFLSCDLRLATPISTFRMPPVQLARIYYLDGIARIVRLIGLTAATEMLLTGCEISTDKAIKVGALTQIVIDIPAAKHYWEETAKLPAKTQQATKAMLRLLRESATQVDLSSSSRTQTLINIALASNDAKEAISAFHEKRKPVFTGH